MQLTLTAAQTSALLAAIRSYYSDLREEIYHTEDYDLRQELKERELALGQTRDQLEPGWRAQAEASTPAQGTPAPPAACGFASVRVRAPHRQP